MLLYGTAGARQCAGVVFTACCMHAWALYWWLGLICSTVPASSGAMHWRAILLSALPQLRCTVLSGVCLCDLASSTCAFGRAGMGRAGLASNSGRDRCKLPSSRSGVQPGVHCCNVQRWTWGRLAVQIRHVTQGVRTHNGARPAVCVL